MNVSARSLGRMPFSYDDIDDLRDGGRATRHSSRGTDGGALEAVLLAPSA